MIAPNNIRQHFKMKFFVLHSLFKLFESTLIIRNIRIKSNLCVGLVAVFQSRSFVCEQTSRLHSHFHISNFHLFDYCQSI